MPRIATTALPRLAGSLISSSSSPSTSSAALRAFSTILAPRSTSSSLAATARIASSIPRSFSTSPIAMGGHGGEGVGEDNARPPYDQVVQDIADVSIFDQVYPGANTSSLDSKILNVLALPSAPQTTRLVCSMSTSEYPRPSTYIARTQILTSSPRSPSYEITSEVAYNTARLCLLDSLGCAVEALHFPQAVSVLGPVVEGTTVPNGARVIGTNHVLDPIRAAFNNGALIRWLDFNDTWLAAEWGHPSDNLGSIISVADWLSRTAVANGKKPLTVQDILTAAIQAHEIQGNLAIENSFNRVGLDHVLLVKVASAAVVSKMI
ncbi:hypothetical protein CF326_g2707, partial [Tilletia indica]